MNKYQFAQVDFNFTKINFDSKPNSLNASSDSKVDFNEICHSNFTYGYTPTRLIPLLDKFKYIKKIRKVDDSVFLINTKSKNKFQVAKDLLYFKMFFSNHKLKTIVNKSSFEIFNQKTYPKLEFLCYSKQFSEEMQELLIKVIDPYYLLKYQNLSVDFLKKHYSDKSSEYILETRAKNLNIYKAFPDLFKNADVDLLKTGLIFSAAKIPLDVVSALMNDLRMFFQNNKDNITDSDFYFSSIRDAYVDNLNLEKKESIKQFAFEFSSRKEMSDYLTTRFDIRDFNFINLNQLIFHRRLPVNVFLGFYDQIKSQIDHDMLCNKYFMNDDILKLIGDNANWHMISKNYLDKEFAEKHKDKIDKIENSYDINSAMIKADTDDLMSESLNIDSLFSIHSIIEAWNKSDKTSDSFQDQLIGQIKVSNIKEIDGPRFKKKVIEHLR